jgi:serine protease inhibitor ecotin
MSFTFMIHTITLIYNKVLSIVIYAINLNLIKRKLWQKQSKIYWMEMHFG